MLIRLFSVAPHEIYEHPPGLSIDPKKIETGPMDGWTCYAQVYGKPQVVEIKNPVVHGGEKDDLPPYISIQNPDRKDDIVLFWFHDGVEVSHRPSRPCWYQSGITLRFVKNK